MTKLWTKGYHLDNIVEEFMAGDDPTLDLRIAHYDCIASIAHAKMLASINVISKYECTQLTHALNEIITLIQNNQFKIDLEQEDIHTAIENHLTEKLGDIGKKIHAARSRNDQVLTALRLYTKDQLEDIYNLIIEFCESLHKFSTKYKDVPYVGRTHFQKAMPSSIGLWSSAFIESLLDDILLIKNAFNIVDKCPLGSAASYGVSLPIDRQLTSDLLGFNQVHNNVLYANNSRGKYEGIVIAALNQIMLDLSKFSTDIILFSIPEIGYFNLPLELCPGSSLMPNKKNPDPLELIRGKSAIVTGYLLQVLELSRALPSGYNRDFQESKKPLFLSFDIVSQSLSVANIIINKMTINHEKCIESFNNEVFATDKALQLSLNGMAFRDAYQQVANNLDDVSLSDPIKNILNKTHLGATGNLGLDNLSEQINLLKTNNLQGEK
ncbi:MAG: argininosuccinate lyase [Burkholderiales bacterium]|nr:argininosuccinate lyase [Burkholderiales bacterium]